MQVKRVKCPKCSALLDVSNKENKQFVNITCPKCRSMFGVPFSPNEPDPSTVYVGGQGRSNKAGNDGETRIYYQAAPGSTVIQPTPHFSDVVCSISFRGQKIKLEIGSHIVGRKAQTSMATIQLPTDDMYMSRGHVVIDVVKLADGSFKSVLSLFKDPAKGYKPKNDTYVNMTKIGEYDKIPLKEGDIIKMANTEIIYSEK